MFLDFTQPSTTETPSKPLIALIALICVICVGIIGAFAFVLTRNRRARAQKQDKVVVQESKQGAVLTKTPAENEATTLQLAAEPRTKTGYEPPPVVVTVEQVNGVQGIAKLPQLTGYEANKMGTICPVAKHQIPEMAPVLKQAEREDDNVSIHKMAFKRPYEFDALKVAGDMIPRAVRTKHQVPETDLALTHTEKKEDVAPIHRIPLKHPDDSTAPEIADDRIPRAERKHRKSETDSALAEADEKEVEPIHEIPFKHPHDVDALKIADEIIPKAGTKHRVPDTAVEITEDEEREEVVPIHEKPFKQPDEGTAHKIADGRIPRTEHRKHGSEKAPALKQAIMEDIPLFDEIRLKGLDEPVPPKITAGKIPKSTSDDSLSIDVPDDMVPVEVPDDPVPVGASYETVPTAKSKSRRGRRRVDDEDRSPSARDDRITATSTIVSPVTVRLVDETPIAGVVQYADLEKTLRMQREQLEQQKSRIEELEDESQLAEDAKLRIEVNYQALKAELEKQLASRDSDIEEKRRTIMKQVRELEEELEQERKNRNLMANQKRKADTDRDDALQRLDIAVKVRDDLGKQLKKAQTQLKDLAREDEETRMAREEMQSKCHQAEMRARQVETELSQLQDRCDQAERQRKKFEQELHDLAEVHKLCSKGASLEDKRRLEARVVQLEEEIDEESNNHEGTREKLRNSQLQLEQLTTELSMERMTSQKADQERSGAERTIKELQAKIADLESSAKNRAKAQMAALEQKIANLEEMLDGESRERQNLARVARKLEKRIQDCMIQMEEERRNAAAHKDTAEKSSQRVKQLKRQLEDNEEELTKARNKTRQMQRDLDDLTEANETLNREVNTQRRNARPTKRSSDTALAQAGKSKDADGVRPKRPSSSDRMMEGRRSVDILSLRGRGSRGPAARPASSDRIDDGKRSADTISSRSSLERKSSVEKAARRRPRSRESPTTK